MTSKQERQRRGYRREDTSQRREREKKRSRATMWRRHKVSEAQRQKESSARSGKQAYHHRGCMNAEHAKTGAMTPAYTVRGAEGGNEGVRHKERCQSHVDVCGEGKA